MLGKRTADQALLPTTNTHPAKRTPTDEEDPKSSWMPQIISDLSRFIGLGVNGSEPLPITPLEPSLKSSRTPRRDPARLLVNGASIGRRTHPTAGNFVADREASPDLVLLDPPRSSEAEDHPPLPSSSSRSSISNLRVPGPSLLDTSRSMAHHLSHNHQDNSNRSSGTGTSAQPQLGDRSELTLSALGRGSLYTNSKPTNSKPSPVFAIPALPDRSPGSELHSVNSNWSSNSRSTPRPSLYGNPGRGVKGGGNHVHHELYREKRRLKTKANLEAAFEEARVHGGFKSDFAAFVSYSNFKDLIEKSDSGELLSERTEQKLGSLRHTPMSWSLSSSSLSRQGSSTASSIYGPSPSQSPRLRQLSLAASENSSLSSARSYTTMSSSNTILGFRPGLDLGGLGNSPRGILRKRRSHNIFKSEPALINGSRPSHQDSMAKALERARAAMSAARPPPPNLEAFANLRLKDQQSDGKIAWRIRREKRIPLPKSLPEYHLTVVNENLSNRSFVVKCARESVGAKDIGRLLPAEWLNDEIINYWGALLMDRAERWKKARAKGQTQTPDGVNGKGKERARLPEEDEDDLPRFGVNEPLTEIHYLSTFFYAKLLDPGYEKARLGKWTKMVDIFAKDIILIPVNLKNLHWTLAAINMKRKRIEFYDSMGGERPSVMETLRLYLDLEHKNKKGKPFDFTGWIDYYDPDVPKQENGFDCGLFTCMFMEGLSRGEEAVDFSFEQADMPYLRQRAMWEIARAKLV